MKSKLVKKFIYEGLGFPVELRNIEILMIDGQWHPKIDIKKIADEVIEMISSQKERLTGNQIKFIRSYFSKSLREFADDVVQVSHTAVSKWEDSGDNQTNMSINIEKILRLYIFEHIALKTKKQKNEFYKKYLSLKEIASTKKKTGRKKLASIKKKTTEKNKTSAKKKVA